MIRMIVGWGLYWVLHIFGKLLKIHARFIRPTHQNPKLKKQSVPSFSPNEESCSRMRCISSACIFPFTILGVLALGGVCLSYPEP